MLKFPSLFKGIGIENMGDVLEEEGYVIFLRNTMIVG